METKYITIPVESREARKRRERKELICGLAQVIIGVACFVGILALLIGMAYEPVPEIATTTAVTGIPVTGLYKPGPLSAADLWVEESQNLVTASQSLANPVNPSPLTAEEWAALCEVCDERDVDVSLALGLIWVESRFNPNAVSKAGCYGYCQINPKWHPADLSPVENIRYGINYLADLCEAYGSTEAGLTAYYKGFDDGSRKYAERVINAAERWDLHIKPWEALYE